MGAVTLKVAVTVTGPFIVTLQPALPEHPPPLHPAKTEPAPALADNATIVPCGKLALHVEPQLIAEDGEFESTVPLPDPVLDTVSA